MTIMVGTNLYDYIQWLIESSMPSLSNNRVLMHGNIGGLIFARFAFFVLFLAYITDGITSLCQLCIVCVCVCMYVCMCDVVSNLSLCTPFFLSTK